MIASGCWVSSTDSDSFMRWSSVVIKLIGSIDGLDSDNRASFSLVSLDSSSLVSSFIASYKRSSLLTTAVKIGSFSCTPSSEVSFASKASIGSSFCSKISPFELAFTGADANKPSWESFSVNISSTTSFSSSILSKISSLAIIDASIASSFGNISSKLSFSTDVSLEDSFSASSSSKFSILASIDAPKVSSSWYASSTCSFSAKWTEVSKSSLPADTSSKVSLSNAFKSSFSSTCTEGL
mmetsp:Transcript_10160/g.15202  ORF Transcript_10160/g.15202 Transcript_10160/m.15202 type:complete len:239 (+) Transcript_10160:632-1348(+)